MTSRTAKLLSVSVLTSTLLTVSFAASAYAPIQSSIWAGTDKSQIMKTEHAHSHTQLAFKLKVKKRFKAFKNKFRRNRGPRQPAAAPNQPQAPNTLNQGARPLQPLSNPPLRTGQRARQIQPLPTAPNTRTGQRARQIQPLPTAPNTRTGQRARQLQPLPNAPAGGGQRAGQFQPVPPPPNVPTNNALNGNIQYSTLPSGPGGLSGAPRNPQVQRLRNRVGLQP